MHDAVLGPRLKTAGIHDKEWLAAKLAVTVVTIAGQARDIGNDRITALGQSIEQG